MNTKLTLTLDEEVIKSAKAYSKEHGQSLSSMVENYFKMVTSDKKEPLKKNQSPKIARLRGIIKIDESFDYQSVVQEELAKKYDV